MQITHTVLMISPDHFEYNIETAKTNSFQLHLHHNEKLKQALTCFDNFVNLLRKNNICVLTLKSKLHVNTPDAVFPNNWFSVLKNQERLILILYPMLHSNRRIERQTEELLCLLNEHKIHISEIIDLTSYELENKALEGTGSIVFDHAYKLCYVSLSPRANIDVLYDLTTKIGYQPVVFHSYDEHGHLVYHTNVMMSVGSQFAVICKESIRDAAEQKKVMTQLKESGREVVVITLDQMHHMAGNILEVQSKDGTSNIVMSTQALNSYTSEQINILNRFGNIVNCDIEIIEKIGGGSARCMLAEIFNFN